jgi:regulator of protease activity HflC (stomatin/prohibitin superfamily)
MLIGMFVGVLAFLLVRYGVTGLYTVDQNERAVKTSFGRAERFNEAKSTEDPVLSGCLREDEKERYTYPKVRVIPPGGPYFKFPWEKVYKVSIATQTINMAYDSDYSGANEGGKNLEAVTKDQLNTKIIGQLRYRVSDRNIYAYLFGLSNPISHVMGYFVSSLRDRVANFEAPSKPLAEGEQMTADSIGISINDLRKNLRSLNEHMLETCKSSEARYGIILDASLITGIEPPEEVESALAAINTAHNQVSSDISLAQAKADQTIVQSRRAVEIETLKAQAEAEPLRLLAAQLLDLKNKSGGSLDLYLRNVKLNVMKKASKVILEVEK